MKPEAHHPDKDLYRQLRALTATQLWAQEVPQFNNATPADRLARVSLIRAIGVAFAGSGTTTQRTDVRAWLVSLLQDPAEKIRRYAMAALPKVGAGPREEAALLSLLKSTTLDREKNFLGQALDKIGGTATLAVVADAPGLLPQTAQKVKASLARQQCPSTIHMDRPLANATRLRLHLRCRNGLETILRDELLDNPLTRKKFRIAATNPGLVALTPLAPFSLADLYTLRCFATVSVVLDTVRAANPLEPIAAAITSPLARALFKTLTEGSLRYRLEFIGRGHQRGAVRQIVNRAYSLCPDILNDPRRAPWSIDLHPPPSHTKHPAPSTQHFSSGTSVELRPRLTPDPRFLYRADDVDASSHPPLAAAMARLAGPMKDDIVWDPFCGAGLELIERALLGGVQHLYGTDISPEAIAIAKANLVAAKMPLNHATFACGDFRDVAKLAGLGPNSVSLIITNPPMGRRIRIPDMRGLIADLFTAAATTLKPNGRLIFPNPLHLTPQSSSLKLDFRQPVDLGGYTCRLELHRKLPR